MDTTSPPTNNAKVKVNDIPLDLVEVDDEDDKDDPFSNNKDEIPENEEPPTNPLPPTKNTCPNQNAELQFVTMMIVTSYPHMKDLRQT